MNRIKNRQRWINLAVLCALLISPTQPGRAQQPHTITGILILHVVGFNISFDPNGGPITLEPLPPGEVDDGVCNFAAERIDTASGTFTGGDGGVVSGTFNSLPVYGVPDCGGFSFDGWSGTWSGNFYANGTGSGTVHFIGTKDGETFDKEWAAFFSAEEFRAALPNQITSEYISTKYGIRVEDSFGDDQYVQKSWSDHELSLLNDVLKEIPPDMLRNMALTSIIRSKVKIDEDGNQKPTVMGTYFPCGSYKGKDCSGSSAVIRIFDYATSPYDFTDDPNGDKQFKASILHEMIHAYQFRQDQYSTYSDAHESPLAKNYMDATRPNTAIETGIDGGRIGNGWGYYGLGMGWRICDAPGNLPPTDYGTTDPLEDMSESVMMYVYDPQKLQASSMARYNFIRDQIYGGVEYENGVQKKP
jgi:hypothetical protein